MNVVARILFGCIVLWLWHGVAKKKLHLTVLNVSAKYNG